MHLLPVLPPELLLVQEPVLLVQAPVLELPVLPVLLLEPVLLPVLALIFLVCLVPTGMVSLGSVAMAVLYPVLTIIYGSLQGYAAGFYVLFDFFVG